MVSSRLVELGDVCERLYARSNRREFIGCDPLGFVYKYRKNRDREIVALLAAVLAYGRVQQIDKSLTDLFGRMGQNPYDFVCSFDKRKRARLQSFKHRFNTGDDISDLLELVKPQLDKHGSLEKFFLTGYSDADATIIPALTHFCETLLGEYARSRDGQVSRGMMYLLSSPRRKSACKRLNLFLRWMVRKDDVDVGLWKGVDPAKLIVPMDVHMSRICGMLRFHSSKSISLRTAVEVTESFGRISPGDPVKYDFVLCRIGINGHDCNWQTIKKLATEV